MLLRAVFVSTLAIFALAAACSSEGCPVDVRPEVPELLEVTQDPETLTVTATFRDTSDNDQWFTLNRTLFARTAHTVSVGTDIEVTVADDMPLRRSTGDILTIDDDGIVEGRKPVPGIQYVYTVRAFNCYAPSAASNDISIISLYPQGS